MSRRRPARPCRARRSDGKPCRAFAIAGGFVCAAHGGRAPQVQAAARRRLAEASMWRLLLRVKADEDAQRTRAVALVLGLDVGDPHAASHAGFLEACEMARRSA